MENENQKSENLKPEFLNAGAVVWVHAWEFLDAAGCGGGGFDWYYSEPPARRAFETDENRGDSEWGNFLFSFTLPGPLSRDGITNAIDADLPAFCAATGAEARHIGADLLATWNRFGYQMGQQPEPQAAAT